MLVVLLLKTLGLGISTVFGFTEFVEMPSPTVFLEAVNNQGPQKDPHKHKDPIKFNF